MTEKKKWSGQEVEQEIQKVIDEAWNQKNEEVRKRLRAMFQNKKPTSSQFIEVVAEQIRQKHS